MIRFATTEDAIALSSLHHACFKGGWGEQTLSSMLAEPTTHALILEKGDRAVGFILYRIIDDECEILSNAVHPESQGSGLGRQLMASLIEDINSRNVTVIFLEVAENNATARHLYESKGFYVTGKRSGYYRTQHDNVDAILMEWKSVS